MTIRTNEAAAPAQPRPVTKRRPLLRSLIPAAILLLIIPATRHLIAVAAVAAFQTALAILCLIAGGLLALLVLTTPKTRR